MNLKPEEISSVIKEEIKSGMGVQFDPKLAEIMIEIIEEDKDYKFRG